MTTTRSDLEARAWAEFGALQRAERLILRACDSGDIARIGLRRPEAGDDDYAVRAAFIAFVLRCGLPVRGRRLQVIGALIEGRLDLGDAHIGGSLWFYRCRFEGPLMLDGATVAGAVSLAGCHLSSLMADGCTISKGLVLNAGTRIVNGVHLSRARIGGDLDAARLDLRGPDGPALPRRAFVADDAHIGGDVRLTEGLQAVGEVRFVGARVQGDFCVRGFFNGVEAPAGGRGVALRLDSIDVAGTLHLDGGLSVAGRVSACRARVGGDLDATGANFDWLGDAGWGGSRTLILDRARIDGALILRELQSPLHGASFADARAGSLADDATTWGDRIALDGFDYGRIADGSPLDTRFRAEWLELQDAVHLRGTFRMQPWRRLIRVLRRMGHERKAGSIALRREAWLRRHGQIGAGMPAPLRWLPSSGHWLLGLLAGHGHRPMRLLGWSVAVWLACAGVYALAGLDGRLPSDVAAHPLAYSLDRLVPLLDLGHARPSAPASAWGLPLRWLSHFEAVFGWVATLLLVASLAGWLDRDRRR